MRAARREEGEGLYGLAWASFRHNVCGKIRMLRSI